MKQLLLWALLALPALAADTGKPGAFTFAKDDTYPCLGFHAKVGIFKRPNCEGRGRRAGSEYQLKTNSLGLRDKDYPEKKQPGVTRILIIGASHMFAPGLEEAVSPPRLLEHILREKYKVNVEVINGANERIFNVKSYILLKDMIPAYHPDVVLHVFMGGGGVVDDYKDHYFGNFEGDEIISSHDPSLPLSSSPGWTEYFKEHAHWAKLLNSLNEGARLVHLGVRLRLASEEDRASVLITPALHYAKKIKEFSENNKAKFFGFYLQAPVTKIVRFIPNLNGNVLDFFTPIVPEFNFPSAVVETGLASLKLPYDVMPVQFMSSGGDTAYFLQGDWHYSEAGSIAAAEYIASHIASKLSADNVVNAQTAVPSGAKPPVH